MPSDNVTPFRRPRPVRPQQQGGLGFKTHRGKVVLEHALRTLVLGYTFWVLASLLVLINGSLVTITIFAQLGIALWAVIRAAIALVLGVMRKPVPNPRGWLI